MRVQRDAVDLDPRGESPVVTGVRLLPVGHMQAARNLSGLARDIDDKLNTMWAHEESRVRDRAQREGALAAESDPTIHMEGQSIEARAFNRGAAEVGARQLEIQTRAFMDEVARDHGADPGTMAAKLAEYRNGLLEGMPDTLRVHVAPGFDTLAGAYVSQARTRQDRLVAEERVGSFNLAQDGRIAAIERFARAGVRDPNALAALEQEIARHTADLIALGPRSAFTHNGVQYPPDPTRAGALNPVQIAEQDQQITDRVDTSRAMGTYEAMGRSAAWIDRFERGEAGPAFAGMRSEERARAVGIMRSDRARRSAAAREGQAAERARLQPLIAQNEQAVALTGVPVHTISDAQLRNTGMDAAAIAQFRAGENFQIRAATARNAIATASPEELPGVVAEFMPGTPLFAANPQRAAQIVGAGRERGTAISRAALGERVQDLTAEARASGTVPGQLSVEEGRAAGVPPEQIAQHNAGIELAAQTGRLVQAVPAMSPGELEAALRALPVTGGDAAENAFAREHLRPALTARNEALFGERGKPGDYVVTHLAPVRAAFEAAVDDPAQLGAAIRLSWDEQARIGVPADRRQALPPMIAARLAAPILQADHMQQPMLMLRVIAGIDDPDMRRAAVVEMARAGVSPGLAAAAATLGRNPPEVVARLASETADPLTGRNLPEGTTKAIDNAVEAVLADPNGLAEMWRAQHQVTGNYGYQRPIAQVRELMRRGTASRMSAGTDPETAARGVYDGLYGGWRVLNDAGYGVIASVSADVTTPHGELMRGFAQLRTDLWTNIGIDTPALRDARIRVQGGVWLNDGPHDGRFVFYPQNSPAPLAGPDGKPVSVSVQDVQAAAGRAGAGWRARARARGAGRHNFIPDAERMPPEEAPP